jgi:hypothetical protein
MGIVNLEEPLKLPSAPLATPERTTVGSKTATPVSGKAKEKREALLA